MENRVTKQAVVKKNWSFTGVTETAKKVKTESFNYVQFINTICTNSGVLRAVLELLLKMKKSKCRRDRF